METVAFGGGCFWCTEAVFLQLNGVISVTSGYAGGTTERPTYEEVCTGKTGHAEVIKVEYDPSVISFRKLLEVFFSAYDPTTPNRQGADVGTQYRSMILYASDAERREAEQCLAELTAAQKFEKPIVTEIKPLAAFYPAEAYHRNFYAQNPEETYSRAVIAPKLEKTRRDHRELLKGEG